MERSPAAFKGFKVPRRLQIHPLIRMNQSISLILNQFFGLREGVTSDKVDLGGDILLEVPYVLGSPRVNRSSYILLNQALAGEKESSKWISLLRLKDSKERNYLQPS